MFGYFCLIIDTCISNKKHRSIYFNKIFHINKHAQISFISHRGPTLSNMFKTANPVSEKNKDRIDFSYEL